jgi:hypothetical protein
LSKAESVFSSGFSLKNLQPKRGVCGDSLDQPLALPVAQVAREAWKEILEPCLVSTTTVAIYFGELIFAIAFAIMLLAASTLEFRSPFFFSVAALVWTLAECIYSLLCVACRCSGPARDSSRRDRQDLLVIWLAFVVYLTTRGAVLAGVLRLVFISIAPTTILQFFRLPC